MVFGRHRGGYRLQQCSRENYTTFISKKKFSHSQGVVQCCYLSPKWHTKIGFPALNPHSFENKEQKHQLHRTRRRCQRALRTNVHGPTEPGFTVLGIPLACRGVCLRRWCTVPRYSSMYFACIATHKLESHLSPNPPLIWTPCFLPYYMVPSVV